MTTTEMITGIVDSVMEEIETITVQDLANGANDHTYVRVWPSGNVTVSREAGVMIPESEYFGRSPHPISVWCASGFRESASASDGVFYWEDSEDGEYIHPNPANGDYKVVDKHDEEWLEEKLAAGWTRFTLDRTRSGLVENLDLSDLRSEIEEQIEEWAELNLTK